MRGFTLVELIVVLAILGLMLVLVPPLISRGTPGADLKAASRAVAALMRDARQRAIARNSEVAFTVDVDRRRIAMEPGPREHQLASSITLNLIAAQSELAAENVGRIRFYADGTSTGGSLRLSNAAGTREVGVDWLTGRVQIKQ
jgi:general secretion pathway protein H